MALTFNGPAKLIEFGSTDLAMSATQVYSRWKDFVTTGSNAKYLPAFTTVGGDPLGNSVFITPYFFLVNGWKIRPYPQSYTLSITENLLTDDNSSPFNFPPGGFSIEVVRQFALKTETVDGAGNPMDTILDGSLTAGQILKILLAVAAGKTDITALGGGAATITFRDSSDTKNRVTATMAGSERATVVLDAT